MYGWVCYDSQPFKCTTARSHDNGAVPNSSPCLFGVITLCGLVGSLQRGKSYEGALNMGRLRDRDILTANESVTGNGIGTYKLSNTSYEVGRVGLVASFM